MVKIFTDRVKILHCFRWNEEIAMAAFKYSAGA